MTMGQDVVIMTSMALCRTHKGNAAVSMFVVVPSDELTSPGSCCLQIGETGCPGPAADTSLFEQRLHERVSSLTRGGEYDGLMPNQCSMAITVVAFIVAPLSPWRTGFLASVWSPSLSAVRRSKSTA